MQRLYPGQRWKRAGPAARFLPVRRGGACAEGQPSLFLPMRRGKCLALPAQAQGRGSAWGGRYPCQGAGCTLPACARGRSCELAGRGPRRGAGSLHSHHPLPPSPRCCASGLRAPALNSRGGVNTSCIDARGFLARSALKLSSSGTRSYSRIRTLPGTGAALQQDRSPSLLGRPRYRLRPQPWSLSRPQGLPRTPTLGLSPDYEQEPPRPTSGPDCRARAQYRQPWASGVAGDGSVPSPWASSVRGELRARVPRPEGSPPGSTPVAWAGEDGARGHAGRVCAWDGLEASGREGAKVPRETARPRHS